MPEDKKRPEEMRKKNFRETGLSYRLSSLITKKLLFTFYMHQKNRKISGDLMEDNRRSFTKLSDGYV